MTDERTKRYFKLLRKNQGLFEKLLGDKTSEDDRQTVALCLTEIYFNLQHVIKLTKKISEINLELTKGDLDALLSNLIDLRIEIYDKMFDWIKNLKKPLNVAINKIGKLEGDKSGTNVARKTIRSSMKQFDINLKKIRYYSTHNKPSKKSER